MRDITNPAFLGVLACNYWVAGSRDDVERVHRRIGELAESVHIPHTAWIAIYLALDDEDRALEHLRAAGDHPESYVGHFGLMMLKFNMYRFPVMDQPRFREARARIGFRD